MLLVEQDLQTLEATRRAELTAKDSQLEVTPPLPPGSLRHKPTNPPPTHPPTPSAFMCSWPRVT